MMICEEHRQVEGVKCYSGQQCPWCERDRLLLQVGAMKELLSQYQSNVHLFKHDANLAPMDCAVEPCPKTTKVILGTALKRKCVAGCMDRHFCNAPKLHEGGCHCKLDG